MKTQLDNTQEEQSTIAQRMQQEPSTGGIATIEDNRPSTIYQRKLRETMDASTSNETNPLQRKSNKTGLPDTLKSGIENLSGYSMDDVKVHYNSSKPAQLQAHAYAQGTDIHLAPGQQKHLPHEAWHVVQQKQGRVKPTMQFKGRVNVNDDAGLEKEADVMGARAIQLNKYGSQIDSSAADEKDITSSISGSGTVQRETEEVRDENPYNRTIITTHEFDKNVATERKENDLLFGFDGARKTTAGRTQKKKQLDRKTIDEYNRHLGWNDTMHFSNAIIGIHTVREQLYNPTKWETGVKERKATPVKGEPYSTYDHNLQLWINLLVENKQHIGLETIDLGTEFSKNKRPEDEAVTPEHIREILEPQKKEKVAEKERKWGNEEIEGSQKKGLTHQIGHWIQNAFFRGTSLLGLMFATEVLKAKVFFNKAATKAGGDYEFDVLDDIVPDEYKGGYEPITFSEYRAAKQMVASGSEQIILYNERTTGKRDEPKEGFVKYEGDIIKEEDVAKREEAKRERAKQASNVAETKGRNERKKARKMNNVMSSAFKSFRRFKTFRQNNPKGEDQI